MARPRFRSDASRASEPAGASKSAAGREAPFGRAARGLALGLALLGTSLSGCTTPAGKWPLGVPGDGVQGSVFLDRNENGQRDPGEPGIRGVAVSDGESVVRTDRDGTWSLPQHDRADYFVIKPTGLRVPVDEHNLPRFYYLHRSEASPADLAHAGHPATGPLPERIDFPLVRQAEPSPFRVLIVGDPQPFSLEDVDHFSRDILPELADANAAFGVSLGDIVHDDLELYAPLVDAMSLVGIPWIHVFGNHDLNLDAKNRTEAGATFERVFGPRHFAFVYADVHFIVLDDIDFRPATATEPAGYRGGLSDASLRFVENYLAGVDPEAQVVFLMHIPLAGNPRNPVVQRERLFEILAGRENHWSISAHTHMQGHLFLGAESGNPGAVHHHWNSGTASGSWWRGRKDENGIPHTTMRDGSPNGYSIVTFDGADYSIRFKAARRPEDHQIAILAPTEVLSGSEQVVHANVFAGSERSHVEARVARGDEPEAQAWLPMQRSIEVDPAFRQLRRRELEALAPDEKPLPIPNPSPHLWKRSLVFDLEPGSYWIEVRSLDMFGQRDTARRLVRVVEEPAGSAAPAR